MKHTQLSDIVSYFDSLLDTGRYTADASLNGLQVDSQVQSVSRIAFAVDAGGAVISEAIARQAQALVVHHGIFWGGTGTLNGALGRKVATLIRGGCSLYASHLPLDAHLEVGNNAELAKFFDLADATAAFDYRGFPIGVIAQCEGRTLESFLVQGARMPGYSRTTSLPFGPKEIRRVGIVSGSGSSAIPECAVRGVDLLISGEPKHEAFHLAQELGLHVLYFGHYATETFGVLALQRKVEQQFGLQTEFIDIPSGI